MPHHLIHDKFPTRVVHHLMHLNRNPPVRFCGKFLRLDPRVKHFELPFPVLPHRSLTQLPPALHAVRPIDIVIHNGEHALDFPPIECRIDSLQQFDFDRRREKFRHKTPKGLSYTQIVSPLAPHPPPNEARDDPQRQQRHQTRRPTQSHQLTKIKCSLVRARAHLGNRQHRFPIKRHLPRPERRPDRMQQRTIILHRQLRSRRNHHQPHEHAAQAQPRQHPPPSRRRTFPGHSQPRAQQRNAPSCVPRTKRQPGLPPVERRIEQKIISRDSRRNQRRRGVSLLLPQPPQSHGSCSQYRRRKQQPARTAKQKFQQPVRMRISQSHITALLHERKRLRIVVRIARTKRSKRRMQIAQQHHYADSRPHSHSSEHPPTRPAPTRPSLRQSQKCQHRRRRRRRIFRNRRPSRRQSNRQCPEKISPRANAVTHPQRRRKSKHQASPHQRVRPKHPRISPHRSSQTHHQRRKRRPARSTPKPQPEKKQAHSRQRSRQRNRAPAHQIGKRNFSPR